MKDIIARDPSFAAELLARRSDLGPKLPRAVVADVTVETSRRTGSRTLAEIVFNKPDGICLRDELSILSFASEAIGRIATTDRTITPNDTLVEVQREGAGSYATTKVSLTRTRALGSDSQYMPPAWCAEPERWRFRLGYLLRFILVSSVDMLRRSKRPSWREAAPVYRTPESSWYQRVHGSFNAASAFGDDWIPISSWTEQLLSALLAWPGAYRSPFSATVAAGPLAVMQAIDKQLADVRQHRGRAADLLMIPITAPWVSAETGKCRPLRGCVIQTVLPEERHFVGDLTLSSASIRRTHRNHLSTALAAVEKMLELRSTHHHHKDRLDWLILPELAVHPRDIQTHLVPFARAHKTIILAGLVYERLVATEPLVNSAIWIVPERTPTGGLQVRMYRQGKQHLAPAEQGFKDAIRPFRPCQWIVNFHWNREGGTLPLRLSAAVCYDATDLCLISDLRNESDVFAIPALNRDVTTFDQMALALHYHMFQMVIVANNGTYGGSNAYVPYRDQFRKQVFHLHGQPQASLAFFEIDDIETFMSRRTVAADHWKHPPAGM